jgi:hypothetical protein
MRPRILTLFPSAVGGGAERLVFEQRLLVEHAQTTADVYATDP